MTVEADPLKAAIELMRAEDLRTVSAWDVERAKALALIAIAESLRLIAEQP